MSETLTPFTIHQISDAHRDEVVALAKDFGDDLLDRHDQDKIAAACANHNGLVLKSARGTICGSTFIERIQKTVALGARHEHVQDVTYLSRLVLAPSARHRGNGRLLVCAALCYEYGRTEGAFPEAVALTFKDSHLAEKFEEWQIGAVSFDQSSFANGCHPSLLAVSEMAHDNKERFGIDRAHQTLILQPESFPMIARQIRMAYDGGVKDLRHGTVVRMIDHSDGRSPIVREINWLAEESDYALRRLGLVGKSQRAG